MKIGVISDTHDHLENIEKFVDRFNKEGVVAVFHCGDYCSPFVARKFQKLGEGIAFHAVRGNNDGDIVHLNRTFHKLGEIKENLQTIELEGLKIGMLHGHAITEEMIQEIAKSGKFDILLYGHYHHVKSERVGSTLVVNPGEACGYLTGTATAALIDISDKKSPRAEIITP